jgi:hypothetical protein
MEDYKSIFQSKVFWGALVSLLASLFPHYFANKDTANLIDKAVLLAGFAFTIYGRFSANTRVTLTGAPPTPPMAPTKSDLEALKAGINFQSPPYKPVEKPTA